MPNTRDTIRVLRVIEYVGDYAWVERQIKQSLNNGIMVVPPWTSRDGKESHQGGEIRIGTIGNWPELVRAGKREDI